MKSLFRSIRKKLLNEGKLVRYLTYAIGEVVLIIVGILFALKINDWNEGRKAQEEFDEYVVQLKEDVRVAAIRVREVSETAKRQALEGRFVLDFLKRPEYEAEDLETFKEQVVKIVYFRDPEVNFGLLGQLFEGKTEMIGRDKDLAQKAQAMVGEVHRTFAVILNVKEKLRTYWLTIAKYRTYPSPLDPELSLLMDLDRMRNSTEFLYAVRNTLSTKGLIANRSESIAENLESFLAVLEDYDNP